MEQKWRLPTVQDCLAVSEDDTGFFEVFQALLKHNDDFFWTSTEHPDNNLCSAYIFNMHHGSITVFEKYDYARSRLVRQSSQAGSSSKGRFEISPCGTFVTDFKMMMDWKVEAQPVVQPWPRSMWKHNNINVLADTPTDLNAKILAVHNALIGRPESIHFDNIIMHLRNQKT